MTLQTHNTTTEYWNCDAMKGRLPWPSLRQTELWRRVRLKPEGTRWRTGGEVKGKLANGVSSQYSHTTSERGVSSITTADAHTSAASSRLNWRPHRFKWTRPFRRKTKSGFCACAITFQTHYTHETEIVNTSTCRTPHKRIKHIAQLREGKARWGGRKKRVGGKELCTGVSRN